MKHFEQTIATYVYSHCNMCNILTYFYNNNIKYLQYTFEIFETYICNICFQRNISLLLGRMEAHRRVEFTGVDLAAPVEKAATGPL